MSTLALVIVAHLPRPSNSGVTRHFVCYVVALLGGHLMTRLLGRLGALLMRHGLRHLGARLLRHVDCHLFGHLSTLSTGLIRAAGSTIGLFWNTISVCCGRSAIRVGSVALFASVSGK